MPLARRLIFKAITFFEMVANPNKKRSEYTVYKQDLSMETLELSDVLDRYKNYEKESDDEDK